MNRYRNKFEESIAKQLKSRVFSYENEKIPYTTSGTYLVDFILDSNCFHGRKIYIETKGNGRSFDQQSRKKLIAVKEQHPEIDLRLVFYSDGKIGPKRKDGTFMRQSDWAIKHGFKYSIKEIPKEWLDE